MTSVAEWNFSKDFFNILGQPLQILRRQMGPDPHESKINRLLAKPLEMIMQPLLIVTTNRPNPYCAAVKHPDIDTIFLRVDQHVAISQHRLSSIPCAYRDRSALRRRPDPLSAIVPFPRQNFLTGTKSRIFLITGCRGHPCRGKPETHRRFHIKSSRMARALLARSLPIPLASHPHFAKPITTPPDERIHNQRQNRDPCPPRHAVLQTR